MDNKYSFSTSEELFTVYREGMECSFGEYFMLGSDCIELLSSTGEGEYNAFFYFNGLEFTFQDITFRKVDL